jgi:hypothetical protein
MHADFDPVLINRVIEVEVGPYDERQVAMEAIIT